MQGLPTRGPVVQRNVTAHVATGPRPAAGGAPKPVQINLRDEGFDGVFPQDPGCGAGPACSRASAPITPPAMPQSVMHWLAGLLRSQLATAAAAGLVTPVAAVAAAVLSGTQPAARPMATAGSFYVLVQHPCHQQQAYLLGSTSCPDRPLCLVLLLLLPAASAPARDQAPLRVCSPAPTPSCAAWCLMMLRGV